MSKARILVVDDENKMRAVIRKYLEHEGYEIEEASSGTQALACLERSVYDLLILDVMMPEIDGWTVCREARQTTDSFIIMLTARSEEYDKLLGFELGADDYVTKPFSLRELTARVKALLGRNRSSSKAQTKIIRKGHLELNLLSRQIHLHRQEIRLTPREFDLLAFFIQNEDIVFSRDTLLLKVWGYDYDGDDRAVDTYVRQVRDKLKDCRFYIQTVWGTGYKLSVGDENE